MYLINSHDVWPSVNENMRARYVDAYLHVVSWRKRTLSRWFAVKLTHLHVFSFRPSSGTMDYETHLTQLKMLVVQLGRSYDSYQHIIWLTGVCPGDSIKWINESSDTSEVSTDSLSWINESSDTSEVCQLTHFPSAVRHWTDGMKTGFFVCVIWHAKYCVYDRSTPKDKFWFPLLCRTI